MDSPTAWNVNDKSDYLIVNPNGLRVEYKRNFLHKIYKKFLRSRNYHPLHKYHFKILPFLYSIL